MKTRTKAALTVLCALLLVVASVLGTLAYLTSETEEVTNTFTAGNVTITLDEANTNEYGELLKGEDGDDLARVTENTLKLVPNHTYVKDPTIHVDAGSEDCYVYAEVVNQITGLEATGKTVADQMAEKGWKQIDTTDFYYFAGALGEKAADNNGTVVSGGEDVVVFDNLVIATNADVSTGANKTITIKGYAVQKDNFDTAKAAWTATFGTPVTP